MARVVCDPRLRSRGFGSVKLSRRPRILMQNHTACLLSVHATTVVNTQGEAVQQLMSHLAKAVVNYLNDCVFARLFWLIETHGSSIEDKIAFLATVWIPVSGKPPCTGAPGSRSETQQESKLSLSTEPALPSLSRIQSFSSSFCCQKAYAILSVYLYIYTYTRI